MTLKCFRAAVACLGLLAFSSTLAFSADDELDPSGRPELVAGKATAVAVWEEKGKWYIRSASAKLPNGKSQRVVFRGRVSVKGDKLDEGFFQGLETKSKTNPEWVVVNNNKTGFDFQFSTLSSNTDGLSFTVGPNTESITFHVLIAMNDYPKGILIGSKAAHPKRSEFTIPVAPKK